MTKPKPGMTKAIPMVQGKIVTHDTLPVKKHPLPKGGKVPKGKGR